MATLKSAWEKKTRCKTRGEGIIREQGKGEKRKRRRIPYKEENFGNRGDDKARTVQRRGKHEQKKGT